MPTKSITSQQSIDPALSTSRDQPSGRFLDLGDILLGMLLLLGIALRFYRLGSQGIWLDESITWGFARFPTGETIAAAFLDGHPPLHYLLVQATLWLLPASEIAVRLVSALSSALLLVTIAVHLRRHWGRRAAFYGVWIAALSTFDLYFAQEARMYALFAFLCFLAYALLVEALGDHPRLLLAWSLVTVLTFWTHFYAIFVIGVFLFFVVALWFWQNRKGHTRSITGRWLGLNVALILVGIAPVIYALWQSRSRQHGSAIIPGWHDLGELFAVWSVGLTGARTLFLDSPHLTFATLAEISLTQWVLIGCVTHGLALVWGLVWGWRRGGRWCQSSLLSLLLLAVPVLAVLAYANLLGLRSWSFRGFIAGAPLAYAWAGIGISRLRYRSLRWGMAGLILAVALLSLLPYWSVWTKTPGPVAFSLLPAEQRSALVMDRAYMAPEFFFYAGATRGILGVVPHANGPSTFARVTYPGETGRIVHTQPIDGCADEQMQQATDLWLYGPVWRIRQEIGNWPACVWDYHLWVFEDGAWRVFER